MSEPANGTKIKSGLYQTQSIAVLVIVAAYVALLVILGWQKSESFGEAFIAFALFAQGIISRFFAWLEGGTKTPTQTTPTADDPVTIQAFSAAAKRE